MQIYITLSVLVFSIEFIITNSIYTQRLHIQLRITTTTQRARTAPSRHRAGDLTPHSGHRKNGIFGLLECNCCRGCLWFVGCYVSCHGRLLSAMNFLCVVCHISVCQRDGDPPQRINDSPWTRCLQGAAGAGCWFCQSTIWFIPAPSWIAFGTVEARLELQIARKYQNYRMFCGHLTLEQGD